MPEQPAKAPMVVVLRCGKHMHEVCKVEQHGIDQALIGGFVEPHATFQHPKFVCMQLQQVCSRNPRGASFSKRWIAHDRLIAVSQFN
ncbi:hypothetical protein D3C81_1945310 [compost metagenome]